MTEFKATAQDEEAIILRKVYDQPGGTSKHKPGLIVSGTIKNLPEEGKAFVLKRTDGSGSPYFSTSKVVLLLKDQQFATKNSVWAWENQKK